MRTEPRFVPANSTSASMSAANSPISSPTAASVPSRAPSFTVNIVTPVTSPLSAALRLKDFRRQRAQSLAQLYDRLNAYPPNASSISSTGEANGATLSSALLSLMKKSNQQILCSNSSRPSSPSFMPLDAVAVTMESRALALVALSAKHSCQERDLHRFEFVDFGRIGKWFLASLGSSLRPILENKHSVVHPSLVSLVESMDEDSVCFFFCFFFPFFFLSFSLLFFLNTSRFANSLGCYPSDPN
jgi:hypothetical protein